LTSLSHLVLELQNNKFGTKLQVWGDSAVAEENRDPPSQCLRCDKEGAGRMGIMGTMGTMCLAEPSEEMEERTSNIDPATN